MAPPRPQHDGLSPPPAVLSPAGSTLEAQGRRLGHYAWLEARLFELLGGWVRDVPEPEVKACLAVHSRHHGWHAELWNSHLPQLPDRPAAQLVAPPSDARAQVVGALAELGPETATSQRLVGVYRVLVPRLIAAYSAELEVASPISDAPLMRSLRFVLLDEMDDWCQGERLIHSLAREPETVERMATQQARLEKLLAEAPTA